MGVSLSFAGHAMRLFPCGALFWPAENLLLVADLHLEKGSHFARQGWLLPPHDSLETLDRLAAVIETTGAARVAALGDSLHDAGALSRMAARARERLAALVARADWLWITGNHDGDAPAELGGRTAPEQQVAGVVLRHACRPAETRPEISGHLHPRTRIALRTGRSVLRRCFALGGGRLVLPAYGAFCGGLDVSDAAFAALGPAREALVATDSGLVRVPAAAAAA